MGKRGQNPVEVGKKSTREASGQEEMQFRYAAIVSEQPVQPAGRMGCGPSPTKLSECYLQLAVSAHCGFRLTSESVFVEAYDHRSRYIT